MAYETLVVERRGPVGWLVFNRPDSLNALNRAMGRELEQAWNELEADDDVKVIVNTARGRAFQVGIDMKETAATREAVAGDERALDTHLWRTARDCNVYKPVICAVNGICDGLGFHFVAEADIVVASSAATFVDSHVSFGLVSALEPVSLLPRIGFGAVMRMVLMGRSERFDAARAFELGLVSQVIDPPDRLEAEVQVLAETIARNSPTAMMASKQAIWDGLQLGLDAGLEHGRRIIAATSSHPDFAEGPKAFAARRDPVWAPPQRPTGLEPDGEARRH